MKTYRSGPFKDFIAQGTRVGNVESVYGERESAYGGMPEVSQTVVQVAGLVQPELKIEIKCIAHL